MGESNLAFITRESVSRAEPLSSPPGLKDALSDLQRGNRERRGEAAPVISSKAEGPTDAAPAVHGHAATLSSALASDALEGKATAAKEEPIALSMSPKEEGITTLIGRSARLEGKLIVKGGIAIMGTVIGDIEVEAGAPADKSTVLVNAGAVIEGSVRGNRVIVAGVVKGSVQARSFLALCESAVVEGDVEYQRMTMADTATIDGHFKKIR